MIEGTAEGTSDFSVVNVSTEKTQTFLAPGQSVHGGYFQAKE